MGAKETLEADGVEKVDSVEWGPGKHEDGYDSDQTLAPRPRNERLGEPCGCQTPDVLLSELGQQSSLEELIKDHMCCRDDSCVNYAMREECRSNCEAADFCGNKRLQKQDFIPTAVVDAGPKGRGLAVLMDCKKGDFLAEYVGQAISNKALPKLFRRYQHERRLYIMALDDKVYIDARRKGGVARFINHSCNPNAKVERWKVKGVLRAVVVATRDITKFSEVTFDYQWQRQRGRALTKCYCMEPNCRGTLEQQALSIEQQDKNLQKQQEGATEAVPTLPEGRWLKGLSVITSASADKDSFQKPDETLVNRAIRVYSKEHQEYFVGEVTGYDAEKDLHQVLYQEDFVEVWENLRQSDWMVLMEEGQQQTLSISRKANRMNVRPLGGGTEAESKPMLIPGSSKYRKNYLYVQTPVKDALWARRLVERCERTCSVQIRPTSHSRPPLPVNDDDPEDVEKYAALDQSQDGMVWKLTITGGDVVRAHGILSKNVSYVKRVLDESIPTRGGPRADTPPNNTSSEQVIYPRLIADAVKRKFSYIREKCRNVTLSFAPSESISKQFSRLIIDASLASDLETAKSFIWNTLLSLCNEHKAPMTAQGVPHNLGFLGGELTKDQLALLGIVQSDPFSPSNVDGATDVSEAQMDSSPFLKSFGNVYKCTVWVQPDEDMGRISSYQLVGDALSTDIRKVYIGCEPKDIPIRWGQIRERVQSLERGIKFIHLGSDRIYQTLLLQNESQFFRYVFSVTGATVGMDTLTGDHLMIDGSSVSTTPGVLPPEVESLDYREKADLAAEIVRLQIQIYRDHYTRKQNWIFGRDWTLSDPPDPAKQDANATRSMFGKLDIRAGQQCCLEIAGVVANMGLEKSVAAHAGIILYRYLSLESSPNMKAREAVLACAFLANKAQKAHKSRKLDSVVKAGYKTFYPETEFDPEKEDVLVLEERVIAVESEILEKLDYDVFLRDIDSLMALTKIALGRKSDFMKDLTDFVFSGHVLGTGPELWLKFGVDYAIAACAALLLAEHDKLKSLDVLIPALSLIPLKVQTAVEIIVENAKYGSPGPVSLLEKPKSHMRKLLEPIKTKCVNIMASALTSIFQLPEKASHERRYRDIAAENQLLYIIRGISSSDCRLHIFPNLDRIVADSRCTIFVDPGDGPETNNIVLIGSWRAISLAEHSITNLVNTVSGAEPFLQGTLEPCAYNSKALPGILSTAEIQINEEWAGTNHSMGWAYEKGVRVGGKSCVPGKISHSVLASSGLRWWAPKKVVTAQNGMLSSSLLGSSIRETHSKRLSSFASAYVGDLTSYPILSALSRDPKQPPGERKVTVAISLQRWPPEKVSHNEDKRASKSKRKVQLGFSPAALQEMQLLTRLHMLLTSPQGHPNFLLPVGIALPIKEEPEKDSHDDDPMFSLFKSVEDNGRAMQKDKKVKESPHIVFEPSPFVLPRFLAKKKGVEDLLSFPAVLSAWFHDLLSAMAHCHANQIILRSLLPDQIVIDSSGVAKVGGLYRCTIMSPSDRENHRNALKMALKANAKRKGDDNDDDTNMTAATAPEILLGCPRQTFESDMWMMGCLMANVLLGKPLFSGKDRSALLISQYKVVGTPGSSNYSAATQFPQYEKPPKRYKRGVEKAFGHMLGAEQFEQYKSHVDLIARMLCLDPEERCTALEALQHECIKDLASGSKVAVNVRDAYADQWNRLKESLLRSQEEKSESRSYEKRKAMLISAAVGDDAGKGGGDDLYDMDDLLEPAKKLRLK